MSGYCEYVEFDVRIIAQTDKAVLVYEKDFEEQFWVPWSCVEENGEDFKNGYEGEMYIAQWWAEKEGYA